MIHDIHMAPTYGREQQRDGISDIYLRKTERERERERKTKEKNQSKRVLPALLGFVSSACACDSRNGNANKEHFTNDPKVK